MANSGNLTALRPSGDMIRDARAKHIHGLLTDERWSIRKAAAAIGITPSVLASRMKGETPFLADELAELAVYTGVSARLKREGIHALPSRPLATQSGRRAAA